MCFWIKHNSIRPNHECERGYAVLIEHIYVFFLSLYILEKIALDLYIKISINLQKVYAKHTVSKFTVFPVTKNKFTL